LPIRGRFGAPLCGATQPTAKVIAMINVSQIKEHMEVKGSDGKHVGTVLGIEGEQVKIASGGMDHYIDLASVDAVQGERVTLSKTAEEAVRTWH
jgi:hypothetical protein